jgi:CBS-domain-containing membrane protein
MVTTSKPFQALTAADLMTTELTVIPQHMSLQCAASLLSRAHVTGAPVVDHLGRCVGVISATDFVRWARQEPAAAAPRVLSHCVCSDWEVLEVESVPAEEVARFMTPDPVTAASTTGVRELARMMMDARVHRIIIVDEIGRPVGIVSSMDVLAAVAADQPE